MSQQQYLRVAIEGYLETQTDLHIGSGIAEEQADGSKLNTFLRGDNNQPYIPGSSIKGYLLSRADKLWDETEANTLFGFVTDNKRSAAKLRVSDAVIELAIKQKITRYGIAVDPITGTANAEKHALFRYEVIPRGTKILCRFEMDDAKISTIEKFVSLLCHWNGESGSALGAKTGQGYGRVKWHQSQVTGLRQAALTEWLSSTETLESFYQPIELKQEEQINDLQKLEIFLFTQSPIVIHDPQQVREASGKSDHPPQITCSRTLDNKALIPGTSLKGLLRGWCRKIVMTILQAEYQQNLTTATEIADDIIGEIFGNEKMAGYIQLSDAISTQELKLHTRPMIAIDRFSGGVKGGQYLNKKHKQRNHKEEKIEGALLNIEAALNDQYKADISLNNNRTAPQNDSWKGLLLLALRDAMQDDFAIGWGKSRGFGSFQVRPQIDEKIYANWDELFDRLSPQLDAQASVECLHNTLKTRTSRKETV